MGPKDDFQFCAALKDDDQRELLLKRLRDERRMAKTVMIALFSVFICLMIVQLATHTAWSQTSVFVFVCMCSYVRLLSLDYKVKILLTHK